MAGCIMTLNPSILLMTFRVVVTSIVVVSRHGHGSALGESKKCIWGRDKQNPQAAMIMGPAPLEMGSRAAESPISHHKARLSRCLQSRPPTETSHPFGVGHTPDRPTTRSQIPFPLVRAAERSVTRRWRNASSYKYPSPPPTLLVPSSSTFHHHTLSTRPIANAPTHLDLLRLTFLPSSSLRQNASQGR